MYFIFSTDSVTKDDEYDDIYSLVSISYSILDDKYNLILSKSFIVKSEEKLTKEELKIIDSFDTIDESKFEFIHKLELLEILKEDLKLSNYLVSHYNEHHKNVVLNEFGGWRCSLFENLNEIDILDISMCFTKIKMHNRGNRLRKPSIKEVYNWLFDKTPNLTNSIYELSTLLKCFEELNKRKLIYHNYKSINSIEKQIKNKLSTYIDSKKDNN